MKLNKKIWLIAIFIGVSCSKNVFYKKHLSSTYISDDIEDNRLSSMYYENEKIFEGKFFIKNDSLLFYPSKENGDYCNTNPVLFALLNGNSNSHYILKKCKNAKYRINTVVVEYNKIKKGEIYFSHSLIGNSSFTDGRGDIREVRYFLFKNGILYLNKVDTKGDKLLLHFNY